jgi:hypothetical protein
LRVLSQFEALKRGNISIQGISDLELGAKIQILQKEDINTEIAFLSHLLIPTGSEELTGDIFGTINKLSLSHNLSDNLDLGYNLGYNYFGQQNGDFTFSIALAVGVSEKVGIYIEPYGEMQNFENLVLNFNSGFTYLVKENLQLDFSFGTGVNTRMNFISVGCSWLISQQ